MPFAGEITPTLLQMFVREHGADKPKGAKVDDDLFSVECDAPLPALAPVAKKQSPERTVLPNLIGNRAEINGPIFYLQQQFKGPETQTIRTKVRLMLFCLALESFGYLYSRGTFTRTAYANVYRSLRSS